MQLVRVKQYFFKFIYFERESMSRGRAERERGQENPKQALHCQCGPNAGLELTHKLQDWSSQIMRS